MYRTRALLAALGLACLAAPAATQQQGHGIARLGNVEFKVDCNTAAQLQFHTGMALYHSFAWPEAIAAFKAIAAADPTCGMAQWGLAMSLLDNPFALPASLSAARLDEIAGALAAAQAAGLKNDRERAYVAALGRYVRDHATVPHASRMQAFDDAMTALAHANPDDMEAAILAALVTSANFNPTDKNYTNQLRAAAVLEPLFKTHPNHPGVAHYLIHSYDYPPIADKGLPAARAYAAIAPDAAHALHMPSHIFTRVGAWKASIAANLESTRVAGAVSINGLHAADYIVYAHMQLAQDKAAAQALQQTPGKPVDNLAGAYAYAAMPARIALESGDWAAAAALPLVPATGTYPWAKYPQAEAVNAFARGVGAARGGNAPAAREQQVRLIVLRDASTAMRLGYWAEQVDIQAAMVGALALCAEGKSADCIAALRVAARREDSTEKHVVSPGPIVPARELLAEALLGQARHGEALAEYQAVMVKEPNRYRAMAGAMEAVKGAGDMAKARALAAELLRLADAPDTERASLREAKRLAGL